MVKHKSEYICITGASSGIGYETAKSFAQHGYNLILVARRKNLLEELKDRILQEYPRLDIVIKSLDLSESEQVFQLYKELKSYHIITLINNAGFGDYNPIADVNLDKMLKLIQLNIEALTILSTLYVKDYQKVDGAQLINISSRGGYMLVKDAVTYCASKFYVSAFTEGLALEMKTYNLPLQAKVLAPAATKTEFGQNALDSTVYDYDQHFTKYHSSQQMAQFLMALWESDQTVGLVDVTDFSFHLTEPLFKH